MSTLHQSIHPFLQRDLSILRDRRTPPHEFRRVLHRIASVLAVEASADLPLEPLTVDTPLEQTDGMRLAHPVVLIPVLRAGLGMLDAFLDMIPDASVGHVGLYRDELTLEPVEYYARYPDALGESTVIVLDPMLATGGSAEAAVSFLKQRGAAGIRLVCIVAAPQGIERMRTAHPDVPVYAAALDRGLNERGYIVPGLGDAGDRQFGTF